jgi:hypothetical protein
MRSRRVVASPEIAILPALSSDYRASGVVIFPDNNDIRYSVFGAGPAVHCRMLEREGLKFFVLLLG